MLKKAGIVRRTFIFVALLTVVVTFVSFAILYFAMPSYYLYTKEQSLKKGTERLKAQLKESTSQEECAFLIADFVTTYNVTVSTTGTDGEPIARLSSPFVSMNGNEFSQGQIDLQKNNQIIGSVNS